MKYLLLVAFAFIIGYSASAQQTQPAYLQYKTVPSARLIMQDSTAKELKAHLDKKKPLMIVVFSPECEHCKHETEQMVKNIDKFRNIQVMMISMQPLYTINAFARQYGLNKYKNITVARDAGYVMPVYYGIKNLPYHAFYDKDKKLISAFEGSMSVQKILAQFNTKK